MDPGERFLLLGLRLGRHVDGYVDSYYGPPELKRQADEEEVVPAAALAEEAAALEAELEDGWLRDQVHGVHTAARVLAGDALSYSDEVEGSFGVRPTPPDTRAYEEAHARLDELLPGDGTLAERRQAFRDAQLVDPARMFPALEELVAFLRGRTRELVDLPDGESLVLEEVRDEPWWAFNYYLGDLRSRVVVNADVPTTADNLVELAAHEVYPGHHTEHSLKEQLLVRGRGGVAESIHLVPTPKSVVSEGIAESGRELLLGEDGEAEAAAILRRHGLAVDERSADVRRALGALRRVGLDAALMIHEQGASHEEAQSYVERWSAVEPAQAKQTVRFVTDPTWRAYVVTYSAGGDLVRAYVQGDPQRFARLLREPVRVADLA